MSLNNPGDIVLQNLALLTDTKPNSAAPQSAIKYPSKILFRISIGLLAHMPRYANR
jgi:hypothetical protein